MCILGVEKMIKERILTVAVLPFVNVSADPRIDEIGKGLARAMHEHLSASYELTVRKTTDFASLDHDVHVSALGRTMRADVLLFGCVCESDGVFRAKFQIVDASTGHSTGSTQAEWSARKPLPRAVAEHLATAVARAIQLDL